LDRAMAIVRALHCRSPLMPVLTVVCEGSGLPSEDRLKWRLVLDRQCFPGSVPFAQYATVVAEEAALPLG